MNRRYRTCVGVLPAIAAILASTLAIAANPKPEPAKPSKPASGKQAAKEELPDDPAVAAIIETKPTTPAECIRAATILADLGRAGLGKGYLAKALDAKLDKSQWADLAEQFGSRAFLDLAEKPDLQPEARRLADAALSALSARRREPERMAGLIQQLQDPSEKKRLQAMLGLQEAGAMAVGPLLSVLADPGRTPEHANIRATLAEMGRVARGPLVAVVEKADPKLVVEAVRTLGASKDPSAAYHLLRPCYAAQSSADVKAAAEVELRQLLGSAPDRAKAVRLLTDAARGYFDRGQLVAGAVDGRIELWQWDSAKRQLTLRSVTPETASRELAARLASDAYAIAPDDAEVRSLYLVTLLEMAAYRNGLDHFWNENAPGLTEAKQFGVKPLAQAMESAIAHRHPAAAMAAAHLLGELGTAQELLAEGPTPGPLVQAVQSTDRRLQLAAAEAIVRLQPTRPFAGSSYVLDALAFLAANRGVRGAAVASPNLIVARDLAGLLAGAGYQPQTCLAGKELLAQAARTSDYEVALIDMTIDRPVAAMLLQQLRHDPRTASIRVAIIASDGYFEKAEHVAKSDPLARAFARPRDAKAFQWQLDQLASLDPQQHVGFDARQRQAARALDLLAELSRSSSRLYDLRRVQHLVITAFANPTIAAKAAPVLANVNSAEAQRALIDAASRPARPITLRQAAAAAFRQNVQDHGVLLTVDEIREQYARYNRSEKQDRATQRVLGLILDSIEASAPTKK
ncbi:MAG: hypothetical protein ABFC63_03085 [Thermoguttaceae bacterium]